MVDVDDPSGFESKLQSSVERIAECSEITEEMRGWLLDYIDTMEAEGKAVTSQDIYLRQNHVVLRKIASELTDQERFPDSYREFDSSDMDRALLTIKRERDWSDSSLTNAQACVKHFISNLECHSWSGELSVRTPEISEKSPSDVPDKEDYMKLLNAARNARDKALLAIYWDSGHRRTAIASLRVSDVTLRDDYGFFQLNEDAVGLKDASGEFPLTVSVPYLKNWLDVHPRGPEFPDGSPLFHTLHGYDIDEDPPESCALSGSRIYRVMKELADRADVDRDIIHPHVFRDRSIGEAKVSGEGEQVTKARHALAENSDMLAVYGPFEQSEMNRRYLKREGFDVDADSPDDGLTRCPECGVGLEGVESFCPQCASPLERRAALEHEDLVEDAGEKSVEASSQDARSLYREFEEFAENHPDITIDRE